MPHLTDPQEREAVKAELSRRYYEHYRSLGQGEERLAPPAEAMDRETKLGQDPGAASRQVDAAEALEEAAADLAAVAPPLLTAESPPPGKAGKPPIPPPPASDKRCFIATAAFGTPLASEVRLLQYWRDHHLCRYPGGAAFLSWYYRLSPGLAARLAPHPGLRRLVRLLLWPCLWLLKAFCWRAAGRNHH